MAAIFRESWDHYQYANIPNATPIIYGQFIKWDDVQLYGWTNGSWLSTSPAPVRSGFGPLLLAGRTGPQCMYFHHDTSATSLNFARISKVINNSYSGYAGKFFVGAAVYLPSLVDSHFNTFRLRLNGQGTVGITFNSSGGIDINQYKSPYDGTFVNLGHTIIGVLSAANWHYVEFSARWSGGNVYIAVAVDGLLIFPETGYASPWSAANILDVGICEGAASGDQNDLYFDDLYVNDDQNDAVLGASTPAWEKTFLGDVRISAIPPTADGYHQDWSPRTPGAHYVQVNEQYFDGDTTFVQDSVSGHIDTYRFPTLSIPGTGGQILDIQAVAVSRKQDAGLREIEHCARESSTDKFSPDLVLIETYRALNYIWCLDPNTNAQWTVSSFNASEFGPKLSV